MQDDPQDFFLEYAFAENFDRRDTNPLLKYLFGIGRDAARHLAANIGHMPEHGRPINQPTVLEHGHAHQPVVGVADGAVTFIGVRGQEDVALLNRSVIPLGKAVYGRAKLSGQQFAVPAGNDRKAVTLVADDGRHGGPKQQGVHLFPRGHQAVFNQVERNRIDRNARQGGMRLRMGLNNRGRHGLYSFS